MLTLPTVLQKYKNFIPVALTLFGLVGLVLLFAGGVTYKRSAHREAAIQDLNRRLAAVSSTGKGRPAIAELEEIIAAGKDLNLNLPEAKHTRLWNQWQAAVDDFKQITAAQSNRYLATGQQQELKSFHTRLLALRDSCGITLEAEKQLPASLGWKVHNLKGNVSVMLAYSVLAFEQDGLKGAKFLSDAVADYKTSIDIVDGLCSTPMERALPRWNMELIVGLGEYRRIGLSEVKQENVTKVQEQLEAFIPDVAGFAPGVPLETRVEK
jgi:hypothetical protein